VSSRQDTSWVYALLLRNKKILKNKQFWAHLIRTDTLIKGKIHSTPTLVAAN
jgi:hypothetical protein